MTKKKTPNKQNEKQSGKKKDSSIPQVFKPTKGPGEAGESSSVPQVFKSKEVKVWEQHPRFPDLLPVGMNNLSLRYCATIFKQLAADFELIIESRTLESREYENAVCQGARQKLDDLIAFLKENGLVK